MSAWINHIKEFAKTSGKSYSACLKDPECKKGYTPVERKASAKPRVKKEPVEGEVVKEKKPRASQKKKDEGTLEIVYDKKVPEKKKRFKKVSPPMKLKNDYAEQE